LVLPLALVRHLPSAEKLLLLSVLLPVLALPLVLLHGLPVLLALRLASEPRAGLATRSLPRLASRLASVRRVRKARRLQLQQLLSLVLVPRARQVLQSSRRRLPLLV
jgi:hypothetical protein